MIVKSANKPSAKPNSNKTLLNKKHIKKGDNGNGVITKIKLIILSIVFKDKLDLKSNRPQKCLATVVS